MTPGNGFRCAVHSFSRTRSARFASNERSKTYALMLTTVATNPSSNAVDRPSHRAERTEQRPRKWPREAGDVGQMLSLSATPQPASGKRP